MIGKVLFVFAVIIPVVRSNAWDGYLERMIAHGRTGSAFEVEKGCIIGLNGGALWTSKRSDGTFLGITSSEAQHLARVIKSGDFDTFSGSITNIAGIGYTFIKEDNGKDFYFRKGKEHALMVKASKSAIVIAQCRLKGVERICNYASDNLRDYFNSVGY